MYSFRRTEGWYDGRPVAAGLTPSKPISAKSSASTKTSITRTGLPSSMKSSRHSGNSVHCPRSASATKRLINSPAESRENHNSRTPFSHSQGQKAHAHVLKSLACEIAKLEAAICTKIKSMPDFAERAEIIESVPGFAETSSANLVAGMPELGQVSDEIAAALIGVAPYDDDSGKRRGERHIKGGRRWVRNAIYMPCVGAATLNNPVLKAYYQRLLAKGKEPKVAIIACMRKLIVILNTMIARRQKWEPGRYALS